VYEFSLLQKLLLKFNIIPHPIVDSVSSIVAGRALQVSVKLGVIDALGDTPMSASTIAECTGVSERGVLVLLDCLDALGYVRKQAARYRLTPRGKKFLSKDSPQSLHQVVLFSDYLFNSLTTLEATIQADGPEQTNYASFTPELWEIFTSAMQEFACTNLAEVVRLVPLPVQAKKLLDLGGSHGLYSMALCQRAPRLSAEIIDFAPVEALAKRLIAQQQMTDRVTFRVGDFLRDELGGDYDVILAFNVIHGLRSEANQLLAAKVSKALNPGGMYVILDQISSGERASPLFRLLIASMGLSFFHYFGSGPYAFHEVREWLHQAGFARCELRKTRTPGFAVIIGQKC
jgi:2-polyprenyl-3-methyl-5-hydroxy-6-metoxy-1,4-benzoquinol methylase